MGAGDAPRGTGARWPSIALRPIAALALTAALSLRFALAVQAAPPPIEPTPADACSPCITIVDRPAWDEVVTVVDAPARDELVTVVDVPASTAYRTVVDRPASVVAHHDLVTPERTVARSVLVTAAHSEPYQTWVRSGYTRESYVDTSHWETTAGYWETTPGYTAYEPGYWGYEPGRWEYEPGYTAYEPGHYEYEPGHYEYEAGHYEYESGHWEYESGHWESEPGYWEWDCEDWGCWRSYVGGYSYWVSGYSYWVAGYSYWVPGYSYWVPGYSYWVPGYSYWVPGYSSWIPGYSYWVPGYSYWVAGSSSWVAPTSTYVSSGYWTSVWVDTSHYETAYRWVDDVYTTVYDLIPAVYHDWTESLPEVTHQEAYTIPALTHEETVHHVALTHTAVVHHDAQTRQVQAALFTESRQSGPRAEGTTAAGVSAVSAVAPIVIPVVSSITVIDRAASREAVTVVDVPERSVTRTVVVAPAATVVHRDLVTPETTTTRTVVVTPETTERVTTWVSSGYATSTYVSAGYWDTYNCRYSSWIDDEICSERWVDTSYYANGWVDTSHYETATRTVAAVTATMTEVVPAVYDEWVEVVPEQTATETLTIPAVTHVEYADRPAVTHQETLEYDAVVGGDEGSGGSDPLAGLAFLLGLSALAGAGRYASARDNVGAAIAEWSRAGRALPAEIAPLLAEVAEPAAARDLGWSAPADDDAETAEVADPTSPEADPGPAEVAPVSDARLARLDTMLATLDGDDTTASTDTAASTPPADDAWGGARDESSRAERRPVFSAPARATFDPFGFVKQAWDNSTSAARSAARETAYALAETGNTAQFIATNEQTWDAVGQLARNAVDVPEGAVGLVLQMAAGAIPGAGEGNEVRKLYARTEGKDLWGILGEIGSIKREAQHEAGGLGTALEVAEDAFAVAGGVQTGVKGVALAREGVAVLREGLGALRAGWAEVDLVADAAGAERSLARIAGGLSREEAYAQRIAEIKNLGTAEEKAEGLRALVGSIAEEKAGLLAQDIAKAEEALTPGQWRALQRGDMMAANVGKAVENMVIDEIKASNALGSAFKDTHVARNAAGRFVPSVDLTGIGEFVGFDIDVMSASAATRAAHAARQYRALEALYDMPSTTALKELTAVARGDAQWIATADLGAAGASAASATAIVAPAVIAWAVAGSGDENFATEPIASALTVELPSYQPLEPATAFVLPFSVRDGPWEDAPTATSSSVYEAPEPAAYYEPAAYNAPEPAMPFEPPVYEAPEPATYFEPSADEAPEPDPWVEPIDVWDESPAASDVPSWEETDVSWWDEEVA